MSTPREPIAVIGIGCRLPAVEDPIQLWQLLLNELDVIDALPADRWPAGPIHDATPGTPGCTYAPYGGFIRNGDRFDRELFEVGEYEAERMDPQQGMALELAWHALEDAAIAPSALRDRDVGVYLGVSTRDFDRRSAADWDTVDVRTALGACASVIANRVSFALALCGPSITVDVGCASSLASIHMACQGLQMGECELALAGGVQLIMSPANIIAFSQGKLLARNGRCKSFSIHADGYVCGEGGGIVVLKKLSAALKDDDRIYAVIRGSANNHNGASNGLSAPLGVAQRKLLQAALDVAGVKPSEVGYVETHSIGMRIGDAIEVNALKSVLGRERAATDICYLGSAKPNFGHLEAAAGIVSFLKATLAVHHGVIPKTLYCEPISTDLKFAGTSLRIATEMTTWAGNKRKRVAGVSALSFGGANAHIIIEQAPQRSLRADPDSTEMTPVVSISTPTLTSILTLSGASMQALQELAGRYLRHFKESSYPLRDICCTTATGRAHLRYRMAALVRSKEEAVEVLSNYLSGTIDVRLFSNVDWAGRKRPMHWSFKRVSEGGLSANALTRLAQPLWSIGAIAHHVECDGKKIANSPFTAEWPRRFVMDALGSESGAGGSSDSGAGVLFRIATASSEPSLDMALEIRDEDDVQKAVALAYVGGAQISWAELFRGSKRCTVPVYPMQRQRHWRLSDSTAIPDTKLETSA